MAETKPDYCYMMTPVSRALSVKVMANGKISARHVRKLIRMLSLDLEFLEEDEQRPAAVHAPLEMHPVL